MKFLILTLVLSGTAAHAFDANCKVTKLYDSSYLEESLSIEEYPDVTLTSENVMLGSSLYSLDDGDIIEPKPSVGFQEIVEITHSSGEQKFVVILDNLPTNKTGTLTGQNKGEESSKIADLVCE